MKQVLLLSCSTQAETVSEPTRELAKFTQAGSDGYELDTRACTSNHHTALPPVLVSKMDKMQPRLPKGTEHQKQTEGRWVRVVSRTGNQ